MVQAGDGGDWSAWIAICAKRPETWQQEVAHQHDSFEATDPIAIEIGGEKAVMALDPEIHISHGAYVGLTGAVDLPTDTVRDLMVEGGKALTVLFGDEQGKGY
jgi:hypothetical protein